jgi:hypothetical protein
VTMSCSTVTVIKLPPLEHQSHQSASFPPLAGLPSLGMVVSGSHSHPLLHLALTLAVARTRKQLWRGGCSVKSVFRNLSIENLPQKVSLTNILQSCRCSQPVAAFARKTTTTASTALGSCNAVIPSATSACGSSSAVVPRIRSAALNAEIQSGEAILTSRPLCDALAAPTRQTMFRKILPFSRRLRCRHNVLFCRRSFLSCWPRWSAERGSGSASDRTSCPRRTKRSSSWRTPCAPWRPCWHFTHCFRTRSHCQRQTLMTAGVLSPLPWPLFSRRSPNHCDARSSVTCGHPSVELTKIPYALYLSSRRVLRTVFAGKCTVARESFTFRSALAKRRQRSACAHNKSERVQKDQVPRCNLFQNYTAFPHSSASITPQQSLQLRGATRALRQREHTHTRTKAQHRPAATSGDHGAGMPKSRISSMVAACPSGRDRTISRSLANMKVTRGPLARSRARATSTRLRMLRPSMERRGS